MTGKMQEINAKVEVDGINNNSQNKPVICFCAKNYTI
jgi:hypothetical protein